jgi:hypothetical protein
MDIHKPKPWRGVRGFLKEYVIIVVGVLTALSAEQAVEWLHWRHEVQIERDALRSEVRDNLQAAEFRQSEQGCIDARMDQIAEVFRRRAHGQPLGLKGPVARPPLWTAPTGSWDIAVAGQALGHMPQQEKLAFSNAFDTFKAYGRLRNAEDEAWRRLALLDHPDLLDPNDWSRLHEAWGELAGMSNRIHSITSDILENDTLGERPSKVASDEPVLHKAFCAPLIG